MSNSELETPILSIENVSKRFVKSLDLAGKIAQKLGARVREEIADSYTHQTLPTILRV